MTIDEQAKAALDRALRSDPAYHFAVQVTRTAGAGPEGETARGAQRTAADLLVDLLCGTEPAREIGDRMVEHPAVLAAFFQNVDLLYMRQDPRAQRVGAAVMRALELASANG